MKAIPRLAVGLTLSLAVASCNLLVGDGDYAFDRGVDGGGGRGAAADTGQAPSDSGAGLHDGAGSPAPGGTSSAPSGSGGDGIAGTPGGSLGASTGSAGATTGGAGGSARATTGSSGGTPGATTGGASGSAGPMTGSSGGAPGATTGGTGGAVGATTGGTGGAAGATTGGTSGAAGATTGRASLVQVYYENTDSPEATEELEIAFALGNPGTAALDLSTVTVHYYFSADGCALAGLVERCDFSLLNLAVTDCPTATFVKLPNPKPSADSYVELRFTGAGTLPPAASPYYQTTDSFHRTAYDCTFQQSNDYSYAPHLPAFTLTHTMTAYINGALVWGTEP
jgi:Cellulose binding domain